MKNENYSAINSYMYNARQCWEKMNIVIVQPQVVSGGYTISPLVFTMSRIYMQGNAGKR